MQKWLSLLVYLSIFFLAWYLWKADFLHIPQVKSYSLLALSIVLLFSGYLAKSKVWQLGLRVKGWPVLFRDAFISTAISELGKYIPGKVWMILGRAGYISGHYALGLKESSGISLVVQFIIIWAGMLIGLIGLIFISIPLHWVLLLATGWFFLTIILFFKPWHRFLHMLAGKFLKREVQLPFIDTKQIRPIFHWFFIDWLVRMSGFYTLLWAIDGCPPMLAVAAGFPLALTLGVLAVFAPGGIGVREGVITVWLHAAGFDLPTAASIAITVRLYTLAGEIGVFAAGMIMKKKAPEN